MAHTRSLSSLMGKKLECKVSQCNLSHLAAVFPCFSVFVVTLYTYVLYEETVIGTVQGSTVIITAVNHFRQVEPSGVRHVSFHWSDSQTIIHGTFFVFALGGLTKTISTIKQHTHRHPIKPIGKALCVFISQLLPSPAGLTRRGTEAFEVSSHHTLCQMKCYHAWSLNGLCH